MERLFGNKVDLIRRSGLFCSTLLSHILAFLNETLLKACRLVNLLLLSLIQDLGRAQVVSGFVILLLNHVDSLVHKVIVTRVVRIS